MLLSKYILIIVGLAFVQGDFTNLQKPRITDYPKDSYPLHGQQLTLYCRAEGNPAPSLVWYKDNKVVQSQRDKPGTSNKIIKSGELLFLSFGAEDEGQYYCNATNRLGWAKSPYALLKAAFLNTNGASGPESKVANIGQTVLLECIPPSGLPTPVLAWTHDGQDITDFSRIKIIDNNLRIESVRRQDAGNYQCSASNPAGRWESNAASLTVRRKPRFKYTPMSKLALVGGTVEFQCLATEDPNSTIIWKRDGDKVSRALLKDRRTLRIENVQLSDAGDYICEAKNTAGYVEATAQLTVISPPISTITPEDKTVSIGGTVSFDCVIYGVPPPTVRWIHNKRSFWVPKPYSKYPSNGRFQVFPNGTLLIRSVLPSDEGLYECKASQQAGIVKSSAQLSVRREGVVSLPLIEVGPQNQTFLAAMTATLPCQAKVLHYALQDGDNLMYLNSYPEQYLTQLVTQWYINETSISSLNDPRLVLLSSGSLQIHSLRPSDNGSYTCRIEVHDSSSPGFVKRSTSWTGFLTVKQSMEPDFHSYSAIDNEHDLSLLPQRPSDVTVLDVGDTWLLLNILYADSRNSFVRKRRAFMDHSDSGVRVEVAEFNSSTGWQVVVPFDSSNSIRVTGLTPHTSYHVLVRGVNRYGIGKPFILERLLHTKSPMLSAAYNSSDLNHRLNSVMFSTVNLRSISSSELLADWSLCGPSDVINLITGFRAIYKAMPLSYCRGFGTKTKSPYPTDFTSRTFHSDNSTCRYNDSFLDFGPDSYEEELLPCSLMKVRKQPLVDWDPPEFLDNEAVELFNSWDLSLPNQRMSVGNLRPFMCYNVVFQPFIDHPEFGRILGQKSAASTALTYDSTPSGAPQILNARWLRNATVLELDWSPPVEWERGGILTSYSLRILGNTPRLNRNIPLGAEQLSYRIRHLDPWTNYTIYLSAVTCHGEGVRSLPVHVFAYPKMAQLPDSKATNLEDEPNSDDIAVIGNSEEGKSNALLRRVFYDGRSMSPEIASLLGTREESEFPEESRSNEKTNLIREPWFIVSAVTFSILWVLICLVLIICGRQRNKRQRRRHGVLDSMDVGTVTKNGRLAASSDGPALLMNSIPNALMDPFLAPVVDADNTAALHNSYGNGFTHLINVPTNVPPGAYSLMCNGSLHPVANYVPQYGVHAPMGPLDGVKNAVYTAPGGMHPNVSLLSNEAHQPADFVLTHSTPLLPNGQLPPKSFSDQSADDQATPYASVSVIEQMVFDRAPTGEYSAVHPTTSGGGGRQLSLAEIIPPPPDYPPPSLPPCSPDPHHSTTAWSLGEAPCSGSGEDSTYSDFQQQQQQRAISQAMNCAPSVPSTSQQWLVSQSDLATPLLAQQQTGTTTSSSTSNPISSQTMDWSVRDTALDLGINSTTAMNSTTNNIVNSQHRHSSSPLVSPNHRSELPCPPPPPPPPHIIC